MGKKGKGFDRVGCAEPQGRKGKAVSHIFVCPVITTHDLEFSE